MVNSSLSPRQPRIGIRASVVYVLGLTASQQIMAVGFPTQDLLDACMDRQHGSACSSHIGSLTRSSLIEHSSDPLSLLLWIGMTQRWLKALHIAETKTLNTISCSISSAFYYFDKEHIPIFRRFSDFQNLDQGVLLIDYLDTHLHPCVLNWSVSWSAGRNKAAA